MNDSKRIAKWRQKISERIAEINGLPAPIPEVILKPEERRKLEEWYAYLEADYNDRQLQKQLLETAEANYREAKRSGDKARIAEAENDLDDVRKLGALDTLDSSDLAMIREFKELIRKIEESLR